MAGAPRAKSVNVADAEVRPVLGPAGNKTGSIVTKKSASKPLRKIREKALDSVVTFEEKIKDAPPSGTAVSSPPSSLTSPSVFQRQEQLLHSNLSLSGSCSSDASSDSFQSQSSTGKNTRTNSARRTKQCFSKSEKPVSDCLSVSSLDGTQSKKRCAWVTANTEPSYAAFHDEEWGVPVHDDKKLFELLALSGALGELTWPIILRKRHIFREVFLEFNPHTVAKLNEKKITAPGTTASSLLSEPKLRAVVENARQILKIIEEFGSFASYCWSFVHHKPILSRFRYARQVPVKTSKAEAISKDLVRRGFRCVGPTVIYSFMQASGMTNDHLISCYRFDECAAAAAKGGPDDKVGEKSDILNVSGLEREMDELVI